MKIFFRKINLLFFLSLLATPVLLTGCLNLFKESIDDLLGFDLIPVEHISTSLSIGVFDYETGETITDEVTLLIHPMHLAKTIDAQSNPLDSAITVTGGYYNLGLVNSVVPSRANPEKLTFTLHANDYIEKSMSISLSDTGMTHFDVKLHHKDRLPENFSKTTIQAPLDENGNPLPVEFPFDDTGGRQAKTANDGNTGVNAWIFPPINDETVWVELVSNNNYTGIPSKYEIVGYTWSRDPGLTMAVVNQSDPNTLYTALFWMIDFGVIIPDLNDDEVIEVSNVVAKGSQLFPTYAYDILTPDLSNANDYLNDFVSRAKNNQLISASRFLGLMVSEWGALSVARGWDAKQMSLLDPLSWGNNWPPLSNERPVAYAITNRFLENMYRVQSYTVYGANFYFPATGFTVFAEQNTENIKVKINGYGSQVEIPIEIRSGGHTFSTNDTSDDEDAVTVNDVPLTYARITAKLPEGNYAIDYDLHNYNGEVITIGVPSQSSDLIDATFTVNLGCQTTTKILTVKEIPNTSFRYRIKNVPSDTPWQQGNISAWNLNSTTNILESVTVNLGAVEEGAHYDAVITSSGLPFKVTFTASAEILDGGSTFRIPDWYCQDPVN